jgi:hypothetical protein
VVKLGEEVKEMQKSELFMLVNSLRENAKRKQWDIVEKVLDDTVWECASKDWKERHRAEFMNVGEEK